MKSGKKLFERRRARVRTSLSKVANGRPRLSIHRTNQHMYAQIIDDNSGITIVSASSISKDFSAKGNKSEQSKAVGKAVAEKALAAGIKQVVFDRNGYLYHGRVQSLAEGAREAGLNF